MDINHGLKVIVLDQIVTDNQVKPLKYDEYENVARCNHMFLSGRTFRKTVGGNGMVMTA
jgi:hypothetical protein